MAQTILLPKMLWYQEPVLKALTDKTTKYMIWNASRRIGKSLLAKSVCIHWALSSRCNISYVLPTGDLCRKFLKEIVEALQGSGAVIASNTMDKFITFANGSNIYFHSSESFSRGTGAKYLVFDECAFIDTDTYTAVFKPMELQAEKVYMCSTPNGVGGAFYDYYNKGKTGNKRFKSFATTLEESGLYDDEVVAEIKDNTPERIWQQEYCCEFLSGGISAFGNFESRLTKEGAARTKNMYGGIDFSGATTGKDSTVLTIVNDKYETCAVYTFQHCDTKTRAEMCKLLELWNVKQCFAEQNSIGDVNIEDMKRTFKKITPFVTSNESKRGIVEWVINLIEKGKGSILELPQTRVQFGNFVMERTKTGKIKYGNISDVFHDDLVISYCLACWCCKAYENKAKYTFS